MTADKALVAVVSACLVALLFGGVFLKTMLAFTTRSKEDVSRIRANLEGVLGEAGPGMKVVDIARTGAALPTRSRPAARSYLVTLQRPDGSTEQRSVAIEVSLLGQGDLTVGRRPRSPIAARPEPNPHTVQGGHGSQRTWWLRLPLAVRLVLGILLVGFFLASFEFVSGLPDIAEAKDQLGYVLGRKDIRFVQLYGGGSLCGLFSVGRSAKPAWFYFDGHDVWTGIPEAGGPRQDPPYGSSDPYDRWSRCVTNRKGGRHDDGFALRVINLFR